MSRNGAGVYSLPAGSTVANGDTSDATDINSPFADIEADLNVARPVVAGGTGATTAADARTNLGLVIGTNVQAYDADLTAIAGLTSAADRVPYYTGAGTAALATFTAAGRALVDDADAAAQRTTLGLAIGTDVQAYDAALASLAGLSLAQGDILYATAADTLARLPKGTAGQRLQMNAGATAPEWVTPAALSGSDLLGTITTTSGSSQSLTSLDLTPYKFLRCTFNGVSFVGTNVLQIAGVTCSPSVGGAVLLYGSLLLDLTNGVFASTCVATTGADVFGNVTTYTTATTTVTFSTPGTFDLGSILVYGVR